MRKHYLLLLLAALLLPIGASAQSTLTVANGTATSSYVPVYGLWADEYLHSQMIFPADSLTNMEGSEIESLVWYLQSPATQAWGINVVIRMAEVSASSFSEEAFNDAALTQVWSGTMDGTEDSVIINFTNSFTYEGGNLLIDVQTDPGEYSSCSWTGSEVSGASISGYNSGSIEDITPYQRNFLAKTKFTYTSLDGLCNKPGSLQFDSIGPRDVTFHWHPRGEANTYVVYFGDSVVNAAYTDTTYSFANLTPETHYSFAVRAICAPEDTSSFTRANITTAVSCQWPDWIMFDSSTVNSITFYWSGGNAPYIIRLNDSIVETNCLDTFYTITGLNHSTYYDIAVRSDCSTEQYPNDLSSWTKNTMATACGTITQFPYLNDIETGELLCWIPDWGWSLNYYNTFSGEYNYYSYAGSDTTEGYITSPLISVPEEGNISFSFMAMGDAGDYYGGASSVHPTFEILVSTTGAQFADNSYVSISYDTIYDNNEYHLYSYDLSNYAGQTIRVAIHHTTLIVGYSEYANMYIDDLRFSNPNAPMLSASNATVDANDSASFSVNVIAGDLTGISYAWTSTMAAAGDATMTPADSILNIFYTAAGIDTITVTATNSHGSATATMYITVRNCPAIDSLPWFVSMAQANALGCWTARDIDGDGSSWGVSSYDGGSSSYSYDGEINNWFITPPIAIPEDAEGLVISYDAYGYSYYNDDINKYQVLISPNAGMNIESFTDTLTDALLVAAENDAAWTPYTHSLEEYAGQTVRFAFRHYAEEVEGSTYMYLRNVSVRMALSPSIEMAGPTLMQLGDTATFTVNMTEGSEEGLTYAFSSTLATVSASNVDSNVLTLVYNAEGTDTVKVVVSNIFGADSTTIIVTVADFQPAAIPYFTSFEPADEDTVWFFKNANVNAWYIDTAAHAVGSYGLYISNDTGHTNAYSISNTSNSYAYRALNINAIGDYTVKFSWRCMGESSSYGSSYDFMRVFLAPLSVEPNSISYSTYNDLPEGVIAVDNMTALNNNEEWTDYEANVSVDNPGKYFLIFLWHNDGSMGNQPPAAVDSISVSMATCPVIGKITIDTIGANNAILHWKVRGSEESWIVTLDSTDHVVTDTIFSIDTLQGNTYYEVSVRALCDEGDTSFAIGTSFRTECAPISVPYFEDFEDDGYYCWSFNGTNSSSQGSFYDWNGYESSSSIQLYSYPATAISYAIAPALDNLNTLQVTFYAMGSDSNIVEVGTMSDPEDINTFVVIDTVVVGMNWDLYEVRLTSDTTANHYIAFRGSKGSGYAYSAYTYIDNVNISIAPNCARIAGISVSDIDVTSATVNIDDATNVNNYRIIIYTETDTVYNELVTSASQQVTGLEANTPYYVTAYSVCPDDNSTTPRKTSFRTLCTNGNCNFTVNMVSDYIYEYSEVDAVEVWQDEEIFTTVSITSGLSTTTEVSACLGSYIYLKYNNSGYYTSEITVTDDEGEDAITIDGNWLEYGDTIAIFGGNCDVVWIYGDDPFDTTAFEPLPCDVPSITATNATTNTVTVVWNGTAEQYHVAIVAGEWAEPANVTTAAGPSYTFTGLTAGTQYNVGIRAVCEGDSTSAWAIRTVSTPSGEGIEGIEEVGFGLNPNPATSSVTVDLGSINAIVAVIDQSGREVYSRENASGNLTIDVSQMAKGAYFVRVTSAESTAVRKLIVR